MSFNILSSSFIAKRVSISNTDLQQQQQFKRFYLAITIPLCYIKWLSSVLITVNWIIHHVDVACKAANHISLVAIQFQLPNYYIYSYLRRRITQTRAEPHPI